MKRGKKTKKYFRSMTVICPVRMNNKIMKTLSFLLSPHNSNPLYFHVSFSPQSLCLDPTHPLKNSLECLTHWEDFPEVFPSPALAAGPAHVLLSILPATSNPARISRLHISGHTNQVLRWEAFLIVWCHVNHSL